MFHGLYDIDWENFGSHIAGARDSKDIPRWIEDLKSTDSKIRENAIHNLFGFGQHAGMFAPATPYIIPFLLEVLALEDYPDKLLIIEKLCQVGLHFFLGGKNITYMRKATHIYDVLVTGLDTYIKLINSDDGETRFYSAKLLRYFQEQAIMTLDALMLQHSIETNQGTRVTILRSMSELMGNAYLMYHKEYRPYVKFIISNITDNPSLVERYVAVDCIEKMRCDVDSEIKTVMRLVQIEYDAIPESDFDNPANPIYFYPSDS